MARAGMDISLICLFGRWGSSAVLGYIREAPLTTSSSWSSLASEGVKLSPGLADKAVDEEAAKEASKALKGEVALLKQQ
eukprot:2126775-Amphidinium_carterae.1